MSVTLILELTAKPESADELAAYLTEILPDTRAYKGCQEVTMYANGEDKTHLLLFERWDSAEDHASYNAWRTETGDMGKIGGMLAGPPTVTHLDLLDG